MYKVLDKIGDLFFIKCDAKTLYQLEDIYDQDSDNYEDLSGNIDPNTVLNFLDVLEDGRKTKKIHRKIELQETA